MEAVAPSVADIFDTGKIMRTLEDPIAGPELEPWVGHQISPSPVMQLDLVNQAFADAQKGDLKIVVDWRAECFPERAGPLEIGPLALGRLVAVSPISPSTVVAARIDQLQAASAAPEPRAPPRPFAA